MQRSGSRAALILSVCWLSLSACAQLAGFDMRKAKIGMNREQAIAAMPGKPTTYTLKSGSIEYILLRTTQSITAMYGDYPYVVTFIRLENGKVVDRGLVGESEEKRIRQISPAFVLREWQAASAPASYGADKP